MTISFKNAVNLPGKVVKVVHDDSNKQIEDEEGGHHLSNKKGLDVNRFVDKNQNFTFFITEVS